MKWRFSIFRNDFLTRYKQTGQKWFSFLVNTGSNKHLLSRFSRGAVEEIGLRSAGLGLSFLMYTTLTRRIGPQGFGIFSYANSLAATLAMLTPLGWTTALMRFLGQYTEHQHWGLLRGVIHRGYQIASLSTVLVAVILGGISYWSRISPELATGLRFAALLLPFLAFINLCRTAMRGLQRTKASIFPQAIVLPLAVTAGAYLFAVTTGPGALLVYVAAALLTVLLSSALLLRSIPAQGRNARPEFRTRAWVFVALPMLFGSVSHVIMARTDVLILGAMVDMESVGLFSAALRLATLNTFVFTALTGLAASMIAAAFHGGRHHDVKAVMRMAMIFCTLGALPPFVSMILWPEFLLGFFGPEFTQAALILQILALGQFVNAATGPVAQGLLMTGQERAFAWTTATMAVGNIVGDFIAIPLWGAVGAASVTAVCSVIWNVWNLVLFSRRVAVNSG